MWRIRNTSRALGCGPRPRKPNTVANHLYLQVGKSFAYLLCDELIRVHHCVWLAWPQIWIHALIHSRDGFAVVARPVRRICYRSSNDQKVVDYQARTIHAQHNWRSCFVLSFVQFFIDKRSMTNTLRHQNLSFSSWFFFWHSFQCIAFAHSSLAPCFPDALTANLRHAPVNGRNNSNIRTGIRLVFNRSFSQAVLSVLEWKRVQYTSTFLSFKPRFCAWHTKAKPQKQRKSLIVKVQVLFQDLF